MRLLGAKARAMRLPQMTTRRWMAAVVVVALACSWLARQLYWRTPLEEMMTQAGMTADVGVRLWSPIMGPETRGSSHWEVLEPSSGRVRWVWTYRGERISDGARLIDVETSGGWDGTGLETISIKDHGGTLAARAIATLTRAYRERGWRYVIIPQAGPGPGTGASGEP